MSLNKTPTLNKSTLNKENVELLAEHANAETIDVGANTETLGDQYKTGVANGANIVSATIVTTKTCLIVVFAMSVSWSDVQVTEIKRGGVTKTSETTISAVNFDMQNRYGIMQYAVERLSAGTYQYDLVNTQGGAYDFFGKMIKIVAVQSQ